MADVRVNIQSRRGVLYRVLEQVRQDKNLKHIYEPVMVTLGPYHHDVDRKLQLVEQLKDELQGMVCRRYKHKTYLLEEIGERIDKIRHFYGGADDYSDNQELAEMMLRDACFLICYLKGLGKQGSETYALIRRRLGMSGLLFTFRDMVMLENQIPLWLIFLIEPDQSLLCEYLSYDAFGDYRMTQLPWGKGGGKEPLHLLEAMHRTYISPVETQTTSSCFVRLINKYNQLRGGKKRSRTAWEIMNTPFWSATDLKAKGIHFRRSSNCLTDIKFFSFSFYAQLHLPFFYVSDDKKAFFSNVIAFEMSPEAEAGFSLTAYFNFMKTLIQNAEDVKVLREKGILYSMLASDEEVVQMFKSIDTYGFQNYDVFSNVTRRIDEHCNSKIRTSMVDLINTKFRSPWTAIALLAATILLILTCVQTYFTINPRN